MSKKENQFYLSAETIQTKIYSIRGYKVMLDRDLAFLYAVPTKVLNQAVKRNLERFPSDFMFQLDPKETENWRSQFVTSNSEKMGIRRAPYAFTEQGVAMLSSVLNSQRAIQVNIQIMRIFVKFKRALETHKELSDKLGALEKHVKQHDHEIQTIFEAIRRLIAEPEKPKRKIGFHS